MSDFENVKKEYEDILNKLGNPELISNWDKNNEAKNISSPFTGNQTFEELLKRKNYLEKIIEKKQEVEDIKNKIAENKAIISAKEDAELTTLAEAEISELQEREKTIEQDLENLIKTHEIVGKEADSIIVEIRAGTGGDEAALFVNDLFRMYSRCGQTEGWEQKILDSHATDLAGFKEIIFELKSPKKNKDGVYSKMKYEGGVHRVQRIPATEKMGRVHTSTVSVAILPKPKKTELQINPKDLKIDVYKSSGPGGQYVNKRMTATRITHLPSGLVVASQTERSLQQNKDNAMSILEAKLLEKRKEDQLEKMGDKRNLQIGKAQRAEKIRTYNFPQNRMTDHRIKKSFHNLEEIMEGKLNSVIKALSASIEKQNKL